MYKELSKTDYLNHLNLPPDYKVDATISGGTYNNYKEKNRLLKALSQYKVSYEEINFKFFNTVLIFKIDNYRIWFDTSYGGTYLSEFLHISALFGSDVNVFLGSCGGLSEELAEGDILIPTYSYGDESTTRMYANNNEKLFYADESFVEQTVNLINQKGLVTKRGAIITCQAMLGETWNDVLSWSEQGYAGVEMETSTVLAISNHFKIPSVALLHVTDNLIKKETVLSVTYNNGRKKRDDLKNIKYEITIELIIKFLKIKNTKKGIYAN